MNNVIRSTAAGAVAGFLTRPCCVGPAALSLAGVSSAGFAQTLMAYQTAFFGLSAAMLGASLWMNFRREGGWFNRALATVATLAAFAGSILYLGIV